MVYKLTCAQEILHRGYLLEGEQIIAFREGEMSELKNDGEELVSIDHSIKHTDKKAIFSEAMQSLHTELSSLNEFAEEEGHHNKYVMLAVANRIVRLELEIEILSMNLSETN